MASKHVLMTVAAAALALGISSAKAADVEPVVEPAGWYVSLFGGASWLEDVQTKYDDGSANTYRLNTETDTGFIVGGAIGTHLMDDFRVELEVAYSENDVDKLHYNGPKSSGPYDGVGKFEILTFMGNVWYDVPLTDELTPYLGGGAGIAIIDANDVGYAEDPEDIIEYDSSEVVFAFQLGAGLRWKLTDNIALDVGYRLRGMDGPTFNQGSSDGDDNDANWIWSHNVIGGVSFGF